MKQKDILKSLMFSILFMLPLAMAAQTIKGKIKDASGEALPYINILVKGTANGTTTDDNGEFNITVKSLPATLVVSSIGYQTKRVSVKDSAYLNITLQEGSEALDEIVVTGNRTKPRTILDSPVPIDNIDVAELQKSGKLKNFGVSNFTPSQVDLIADKVPISVNQIEFSLTNTSLKML